MELFKRRFLALICFLSVMTLIFALNLNSSAIIILLVVLSLGLPTSLIALTIFSRLSKNDGKHRATVKKLVCFIIYILISSVMLVGAYSFVSKSEYINSRIGKEVTIKGRVTEVRKRTSALSSFEVELLYIGENDTSIKAILEIPAHSTLKRTDEFTAVGKLSGISFGDEYYFMADGFQAKLNCESRSDVTLRSVTLENTETIFQRINLFFQEILNQVTGNSDKGSFIGALLLGNRDGLSEEVERDFERCGIAHMLALSGLHMSIIMGFFDIIMRNMFIDKKLRCVILIILSVAYLAITGFSPSASRAVIMLCMVYLTYLFNSDAESITSLFIAFTMILLFAPYAVYDVGLWMSVFATLGIIIVSEILSKLKYHIKKRPLPIQWLIMLTVSVMLTFAAVFSICVFLWLCFGEISIVSPITNLIFSPLITAVLLLGLASIIVAPVPWLSSLVGDMLVFVSDVLIKLASYISHWRGITVSLKYGFVPYIIIPLAIILTVFLLVKLKHKWMIFIPPIISVLAFAILLNVYNSTNAEMGKVAYLKDKRSEMLVLSTTAGATICDVSNGGFYDLFNACSVAIDHGTATEIENIILTHYHSFHINSLERICEKYLVRSIYVPLPENDEERNVYNELEKSFEGINTNLFMYKRGATIDVSNGYEIAVSKVENIERTTHPIFAVAVSNDTSSLLYFTSAILETDLVYGTEPTDVMIFGSHGATVKPFTDRNEFSEIEYLPATMLFSDPYIMLREKAFLSYVNELYLKGHEIITEELNMYVFELN